MSTTAQTVQGWLIQPGCLIVMLLLAPTVAPRAAAQGNEASASPAGVCFGPLYDQYNNPATEPPLGIGSQKFESAMAAFDNQAADDFVLTSGVGANYINGVRVMGEYSAGGGPASSFNIYFYLNGPGNFPGAQIRSFENLSYTGTPPDFVICLPVFSLAPGTYWVSVQANLDFNPSGQWFWHNRTVQGYEIAAWQNPGDGYGTGCISWNRKSTCMADEVWPDQVFQILGFREGPPPTPKPLPTPRARPTPAPRPSP